MSVDSNESEIDIWKKVYTPCETEQLYEAFEKQGEEEEEENKKKEEEEDIELWSEKFHKVPIPYNEIYEEKSCNQLHLAFHRRDTETVRRLLKSSVDVNLLRDIKNNIPKLYAILKELLSMKAIVDPNDAFDPSSLHTAQENARLGITHEMLKSNVNTNKGNDSCHTPLPISLELGCAEIVKALIEYVGGINAVDKNGETALHLAARNDRNTWLKVLINQSQVFHPAELELSQQPSRNKIDVDQIAHHVETHGSNFEAEKNSLGCNPSANVNVDSTGQATPFYGRPTAERDHADIVENLISNGANVNACNNKKMTPLHLACQHGHSSIIEILLDNGCHVTVDVTKQSWETPFYLAAKNGHADVVDVLLRRGICEFVPTFYNETPLHVAVIERHTKVVEVILKHSCRNFDKLTNGDQTLEQNAENFVVKRNIIPTKLRKSDGRHVSAGIVWAETRTPLETMLGSGGMTALDYAVKSIQPKMVKILLSKHRYSETHLGNSFRCLRKTTNFSFDIPNINQMNITDLMEIIYHDIQHKMICKNIKEIARALVNACNFNANYQDDHLNTFFHDFIHLNQCVECLNEYFAKTSRRRRVIMKTTNYVLQLLLKKGADFNMKNNLGKTPLIIASQKGCSHVIQKFFDWEQKSGLKLDLDAKDQDGATALIRAAETHNVSAIRLLLSHKVSVNLHDVYGITALHAAIFEPIKEWFDLHISSIGLPKRKHDYLDKYLEILRSSDQSTLGKQTEDSYAAIDKQEINSEYVEETIRYKQEMVELLLEIEELNVNATDFRGNTPLDLAAKSSIRINLETFKALKDRGATRTLQEPDAEAPLEVARFDERGRSPLHRLIISNMNNYAVQDMKIVERELSLGTEKLDLVSYGMPLKPDDFRQSTTENDGKGRTPHHFALMSSSYVSKHDRNIVKVPLEIGSSVNAVDKYSKTPMHYAETMEQYKLLIKHGADETIKDKNGHTPKELRQLLESVTINTDNAKELSTAYGARSSSIDIEQNLYHVTELSKQKLIEVVQIYSQSSRPRESSEEAIWRIWIENDFLSINRRVGKLKPAIQSFIERLANGIKEKDGRFDCQPILVGSADEETKVDISADFDFNFKLTKFSQLCDVFPHPLGPNGYFQLRRKSDSVKERQINGEFDCFFNSDQCLQTDEVNARFQIVLEDVLHSHNIWKDGHLFEWNLRVQDSKNSEKFAGLCKTVRLRMINPIADGEGGLLFVSVSIDVVACIHVEDSCSGCQLPVDINPVGKADSCTLVFDRPRFDSSKPHRPHSVFSETFARISFAPLESRIIRESSSLAKAAYMVCKLLLYVYPKTTYQLKTCLLFCKDALHIQEGCERKDEDKITPRKLAFWVERLLFCLMEFYQHAVYPCYFMPSFKQRVAQIDDFIQRSKANGVDSSLGIKIQCKYSVPFDIYLDLCPEDTATDIPIIQDEHELEESIIANRDPMWEQFDREEFIIKLASRRPSHGTKRSNQNYVKGTGLLSLNDKSIAS